MGIFLIAALGCGDPRRDPKYGAKYSSGNIEVISYHIPDQISIYISSSNSNYGKFMV